MSGVHWSVGVSVGPPVGRLVHRSVARSIGRSIDRFICPSVQGSVHRSVDSISCSVHRSVGASIGRKVGPSAVGPSVGRSIGRSLGPSLERSVKRSSGHSIGPSRSGCPSVSLSVVIIITAFFPEVKMIMDFTISKSKVSGIIIIIIYVFLDSAPSRLGLSTQYCIQFNYGQTRDELNITERSLGLGFQVQTLRRRMPQ